MRYEPIPDDPMEEAFLASPIAPLALLDTFVSLVQAGALIAGARHGVFEGLRNGPSAVEDLATELKLDADTLLLLLRVLSSNGYVTQDGQGSYQLSGMGRAALLEGSPERQARTGTSHDPVSCEWHNVAARPAPTSPRLDFPNCSLTTQ